MYNRLPEDEPSVLAYCMYNRLPEDEPSVLAYCMYNRLPEYEPSVSKHIEDIINQNTNLERLYFLFYIA